MVVTTKERRSKLVDREPRVPRQNTRIRLRPRTTSLEHVAGETLLARAIAAGAADPAQVAQRLLDAADRRVEPLRSARSTLTRRLQLRSNDFEATLALRIVERALAEARHPDGPWRWQNDLSPRRVRAARRRAARRRHRPALLERNPHATGRRQARMNGHADGILLPGVLPVEKLPELGIVLPAGNYATVAGAVLDRLGRIPETPGDTVRIAGWEIEVVDVEGRAITGVLVRPLATSGVDR
jgi:hypothetical protein